jgi:DNA end-binding protein Ku
MAPRPHWKGYLQLSLVTCPIALYPAVSAAERVSFRKVNRETGNRLRQQLVDSITGQVVESHQEARGYEVGQNRFLMVEEEELETAQMEARTRPFGASASSTSPVGGAHAASVGSEPRRGATSARKIERPEAPQHAPEPTPPPVRVIDNRTIEIERFVPVAQIDARYHDKPYYIAPRDQVGQDAFAVIRDAMGGKGMAGMGRVVLSNRERPIVIEPMGKGLRGMTLRYAHEIRMRRNTLKISLTCRCRRTCSTSRSTFC